MGIRMSDVSWASAARTRPLSQDASCDCRCRRALVPEALRAVGEDPAWAEALRAVAEDPAWGNSVTIMP